MKTEYKLMREGIGYLHCMTDDYIVEDLMLEWQGHGRYGPPKDNPVRSTD